MTTIADIAGMLQTAAVATFGTNLFAGGFDESPDTQLALSETPGMLSDHVLGQNPPAALHPRIQITSRAVDYVDAEALAQAAFDAIGNLTGVVVGGVTYIRVEALQPPSQIGRDENGRWIFGFNLQVTRSP